MMNWSVYLTYLKISAVRITKCLFLVLILLSTSNAQQKLPSKVVNTQNDTLSVESKSPWGAVLRSAIIPGWGQIYNHSYIKAPIIWGITGWLVYGWIQNNNNYKIYQKSYLKNHSLNIKENRNFYHDQRDLFAIYIGLTYVLNLVDAYVDAQLFNFNVKQDFRTSMPMLNLQVNF